MFSLRPKVKGKVKQQPIIEETFPFIYWKIFHLKEVKCWVMCQHYMQIFVQAMSGGVDEEAKELLNLADCMDYCQVQTFQ